MPNNRFKLTAKSIQARCRPPQDGEVTSGGRPVTVRLYWDTEYKGFCLAVTRRNKTFKVQRDVRGRSVTVTIGRLGVWTVDEARRRARELIVQMDKGVNPNQLERERAARGTTLAEAVEWHVAAMRAKRCAERSIQTVRDEAQRHLGDWLSRPLADLRPNECAVRHERITRECGPYAANRALQTLRACYNTATRRMDDLPPCPVRGVTFNRIRRRREPIPWAKLPGG